MTELEELVRGEEALKDMTLTLHKMSEEEEIRYQCWAREDYEMSMRGAENAGLKKGRAEGRAKEIFDSVREGDYSFERGAEKLGITVEEFKERYNSQYNNQ